MNAPMRPARTAPPLERFVTKEWLLHIARLVQDGTPLHAVLAVAALRDEANKPLRMPSFMEEQGL